MVADKMVRTKWYGQNCIRKIGIGQNGQNGTDKMVWTNGMDKMVYGQNGIGQNGMDKMVRTKWYNFIFCDHFNSVEFNIIYI